MDSRLVQRGPPTIIVGTMFTLASPAGMAFAAAQRQPVKLHACRFGHGVKMVAAGTILLPAGLLLSLLHLDSVPAAWMDGVVDAFQEDYCTRPCTAVMP